MTASPSFTTPAAAAPSDRESGPELSPVRLEFFGADPETQTSPTIGKIAGALARAQGMMAGATRDGGAEIRGRAYEYATLASVWEAIRGPLSTHALAVIQTTVPVGLRSVCVVTTLAHESGEWVSSRLEMPVAEATPQAFGSALTYARRYGLMAIAGIAAEDDDGARGSGTGSATASSQAATREAPPKPAPPVQLVFPSEITEREAELIVELSPLWARAKTVADLDAVIRRSCKESGGKGKASPRYQRWHQEMRAQVEAALGVKSSPGIAGGRPGASGVAQECVGVSDAGRDRRTA